MAEYIEREKLIRNAELCRETTDAFIEIMKNLIIRGLMGATIQHRKS